MAKKIKHLLNVSLLFSTTCFLVMMFNISAYQLSLAPLALIYVPLAFIGQAYAMGLLLLIALLPFFWMPKKWFSVLFALTGGSLFFLLAIDSWVFSVYRFHINSFFINMFFTDRAGMGIETSSLVFGGLVWLLVITLFYFLALKLSGVGKLLRLFGLYLFLFVLTFIGQSIHAWGYAHNMKKIVSLTHVIPLYYPLIATKDIKKWGWFREDLVEDNLVVDLDDVNGFNYPLAPLNCPAASETNIIVATLESWRFDRMNPQVTPNIYNIGQQSLVFNNHLSTGTVTDRGLFGLMYGVSPAYLTSAFGAGKEPALISALQSMNYQSWVLANQDIEVNKLDKLFFPKIKPLQSNGRGQVFEGDAGIVTQLIEQIESRDETRPFFGYLLFNSSHFPYWTPPEYKKPFEPSERFSPSKATDDTQPEPYFNQYSNSIHYIDSLIGQLHAALKSEGLWENTILVITGDHGEEFRDQSVAFWGHGSNFSRFQSGVPLVVHWPGRLPAAIDYRTSHEDVFATLVTDALNCGIEFSDISTGASLFSDESRVNIIESYVIQAIVDGDVVTELYPGFVNNYALEDISKEEKASAKSIQGVRRILSQFH